MIPESKVQKFSCSHEKFLHLRLAKHEKEAIYAVNQRISNVYGLREL